jgi:hypothetical protein
MNITQNGSVAWDVIAGGTPLDSGFDKIAAALYRRCKTGLIGLLPVSFRASQCQAATNPMADRGEAGLDRKSWRQWPAEIQPVSWAELRSRCAAFGIFH